MISACGFIFLGRLTPVGFASDQPPCFFVLELITRGCDPSQDLCARDTRARIVEVIAIGSRVAFSIRIAVPQ
jgi:hypothetical protein